MKHHLKNFWDFVVLANFLLFSCQTTKSNTALTMDKTIHFVDTKEAASFAVPFSGTTVIDNQETWDQWWKQYWNRYSGSGEKTPPPEINFEKEMIISVHWGTGYSGCSNKVEAIDRIERTPDSINVVVNNLPDLGPCDMVVHPIQMVKITRTDLPVKFSGSIPKEENN